MKTILQIGEKKTDIVTKSTGLILDIVPLENPYRIREADTLSMKVLFKGEPLSGKMMRIWHRLAGKVTESAVTTNEEGIIRLAASPAGEWMVSCVTMTRLENDPRAQWQSYWGSLTWGYTRNRQKQAVLRGHH